MSEDDAITIRAASADDVEAVLALWALARSAHAATADQTAGALWDAAGYPVDSAIGRRVRNL